MSSSFIASEFQEIQLSLDTSDQQVLGKAVNTQADQETYIMAQREVTIGKEKTGYPTTLSVF